MSNSHAKRISTGVAGLDEILLGGLIPRRVYLVRGAPGTGKSTLALHFLSAGVANGERTLYISLANPEAKIREDAPSMGFSLDGVSFLDLSPRSAAFSEERTYDIFSPAEVEREPTTRAIVETVERLKPERVAVDPTTQLRYLTPDPFQFRRQVLSFLRFLVERGATVLWTSEASATMPDDDLQFMSDGVIHVDFAPGGWAVTATKYLGSGYVSGKHAMQLTDSGMRVFPRLVPDVEKREFAAGIVPSGIGGIDEMLHGGLELGSITIVRGPSGRSAC